MCPQGKAPQGLQAPPTAGKGPEVVCIQAYGGPSPDPILHF